MKKIFRMLFFSAISLYLTSLWNKGFTLHYEWQNFLITTLSIAVLYYLINPVAKIILLPVNIITFGLISLVVYFLLFHFVITHYSLITIKSWLFPGLTVKGFSLPSMQVSYYLNVALSAFSVSTFISLLEGLL